ncbi:MAG: hypothetical protein K2L21_01970 [Muribaculaceae bacterium]|nr:hypothetical protein [Muribaculaceae bacterium]
MKKIISALLVIFALGFASQAVSAQSCSIRGTNGDTVQVFSSSLNGSSIDITLGSDSQYAANLEVTATVTYSNPSCRITETRTFSTWCIAQPSQTTSVSLNIESSIRSNGWDLTPSSFSITLSGNKCN